MSFMKESTALKASGLDRMGEGGVKLSTNPCMTSTG